MRKERRNDKIKDTGKKRENRGMEKGERSEGTIRDTEGKKREKNSDSYTVRDIV